MTVREMIERLFAVPEEDRDRPLFFDCQHCGHLVRVIDSDGSTLVDFPKSEMTQ